MGKHCTRRGIRYRLCGLRRARNTSSDEYEPPTNKSGVVGPGDQPTGKGVSFSAFLGVAGTDGVNGDFMCRFFRVVCRTCSTEWVPWTLVHLRVPILDSFLVDHSYQVRLLMAESKKLQ